MTTTKTATWYTKNIPDILIELDSRESGLTKEEIKGRLEKYGPNKLPQGKPDSLAIIFLQQFQSPLIYLLFLAASIIFLIGEITDSLIILAVLLFNAIIGTAQEGRTQNTLLALKKFTETKASVIREGKEFIIDDSEITPGDIIILQEGEKVPADARMIFTNTLKIDEASLTGESEPVTKTEKVIDSRDVAILDQKNMVFKGTNVLSGHGTAIIVATGINTEIGKIAQKISNINTDIPLKKNIQYLSRLIIAIASSVSVLIVILGIIKGNPFKEMFMTAVALSVSIIPEGLPVVITLVLATGVRRMSKHNVLVKKLQAVEALGQTKIIAVDKTGTLTKNEMVIEHIYVDDKNFKITGNGYEPTGEVILENKIIDPLNHPELLFAGKIAAFCANARISILENNTWKVAGDPTEAAMLVFSEKIGFHKDSLEEEAPTIFEIPFDYKRKYHATMRLIDNQNFLTVIGAPEKILGFCQKIWRSDGIQELTSEEMRKLELKLQEIARSGFRVIAYAVNIDNGEEIDILKMEEQEEMPALAFVGFFGMNDALRTEVKASVQKVQEAGMKVVMITGDHILTAQAIAEEAGIWHPGENILTGEEIDSLSEEELIKKLGETSIFTRVTPNHKLRIIEAYRKRGDTVAMTGDGVNDAPSLVAADLGVAMGKIGTEVAKEASDIVLLDDNFANIVKAAEEGRAIYKTIKKVILYLFSTSIGEVLTIIFAIILGYPLPLLAAQIIWLNFVTDGFLDLALALEPKEKGLMKTVFEKPKKWIVDGLMLQRMILMSIPMAIGTIYLFSESLENPTKALSISLTTLAVFQWFNAWNCRSETKSIFQMNPFSNKFLVAATLIVVSLQFAALHNPSLQKILYTTPLSVSEWLMILPIAFSIIIVEEIRKFFYRRKLLRN